MNRRVLPPSFVEKCMLFCSLDCGVLIYFFHDNVMSRLPVSHV